MRPWFAVHRFWGWYPKTWEGYSVLILMALGVILSVVVGFLHSSSTTQILINSFPLISFFIGLAMLIVQQKGENPVFNDLKSDNFSPDNPKIYVVLPIVILAITLYYFVNNLWFETLVLMTTSLLLLRFFQVLMRQAR